MSRRIVGILIKSQQYYLKEKGYYKGKINGIWSEECQEAMDLFKLDPAFKPANPKRGNGPFLPFERLPQGFKWEVLDGQRAIVKDEELPYFMTIQALVDGILADENDTSENKDTKKDNVTTTTSSPNQRNAMEVIGTKNQVKKAEEIVPATKSESISDFVNNPSNGAK